MVYKVLFSLEILKVGGQSSLGISGTKWKSSLLLCQPKQKWHMSSLASWKPGRSMPSNWRGELCTSVTPRASHSRISVNL